MSDQKDKLRRRVQAYKRLFEGEGDAAIILEDLRNFCYADKPTFSVDDPAGRIQAYREGRREVWLRIQEYLRATSAEIDR